MKVQESSSRLSSPLRSRSSTTAYAAIVALSLVVQFLAGCGPGAESSSRDAPTHGDASMDPGSAKPLVPDVTDIAMQPLQTAEDLKQLRAHHDATVWSDEVLAQKYETAFVQLWDNLIHKQDKFAVLKAFPFRRLEIGTMPVAETLDWDIVRQTFTAPIQSIPREAWPSWVDEFRTNGYRVIETEFHHSSFQPGSDGATSKVSFVLHADRPASAQRFIVRGNLQVKWESEPDGETGIFQPEVIDATDLVVLEREGLPAFEVADQKRFPTDPTGRKAPTAIHPIILQDLDNDGLPEVIVAAYNLVFHNQGGFRFAAERLCEQPVPHINAAAFADFDGDGIRDYLVAIKNGFPCLYHGEHNGRFPGQPTPLLISDERLRVPINVVPGDIDGDGDLDVFLGQQKPGYFNGDIPTPYFDALDSFPSYVLRNDGQGNFEDVTAEVGLGQKYRRRNFAASWIDFDADGDLDLIMTSDFSGTDLFLNDGTGNLTDVTSTLKPQAYGFGMSHTFGDYNLDGAIDFLSVGMSSTTARRLEHLNLGREGFQDHNEARMKMGYGNRMYLWNSGQYVQAPFNDDVARTGWSWGSTTLDFDNDGDPDIYVVNGQTSGQTTRDYCTSFWCHDVYYKAGERPDAAIRDLFEEMVPLFDGNGISWNGYEHNALLMNVAGESFINVGFLMNASFEFDSRAVVSGDLDGDGRVDLVVEQKDHRASEAKLYFVRNLWNQGSHWIGVHLRQGPNTSSPIGARVTLKMPDGRRVVQHNVAGHSVWAQHANTVHFGLGEVDSVESIEVVWPDGSITDLSRPNVDRYHSVTAEPTTISALPSVDGN
jgi:hypothetical protein